MVQSLKKCARTSPFSVQRSCCRHRLRSTATMRDLFWKSPRRASQISSAVPLFWIFMKSESGDGCSNLLLYNSLPLLPLLQFGLPLLDTQPLLSCIGSSLDKIPSLLPLGIPSWDHLGLDRTDRFPFGTIQMLEKSTRIH
jgi:hypothetical protein